MAVKVNIARNGAGTSTKEAAHADGVSFLVKDEHLFVYDNRDYAIAAYAPSKWTDVTVASDPK